MVYVFWQQKAGLVVQYTLGSRIWAFDWYQNW